MTSAIGVAILVATGTWLFGGLLGRWAGVLLVLVGSVGLAATGDGNGFLLIALGGALWLAGHLLHRVRRGMWKSALAERVGSGSVLGMAQSRGNNRPDASRRFSGRSGISLNRLLKSADRIRESRSLPGGSPGAAKLIREDRDR